jgi:chromosome segregation ATPase
MVSLEQIRALEARVEKAVVLIDKLRRENAELEQRLIEASRSEEQVKAAYSELERKTQTSIRLASNSEARIGELANRLQEAEEKAKSAELKAAEADERAAAMERKAQAAEAENTAYRERALAAEHKSADLEAKAEELRREQSRIEDGLAHALQKLDAFEDLVMGISVGNADTTIGDEASDAGEEKAETVEQSPAVPEPQESPFPGASFRDEQLPGDSSHGDEHELDIF